MFKKIILEVKTINKPLVSEIKKDFFYFSLSGFLIGFFMVLHDKLKALYIIEGENWAKLLFSDFIPFYVWGWLILSGIGISGLTVLVKNLGFKSFSLESRGLHFESRLTQILSSVTSFIIGISSFALLYSALTFTSGGLKLTLSGIQLLCLMYASYHVTIVTLRGVSSSDQWWGAIGAITLVIGAFVFLIFKGP